MLVSGELTSSERPRLSASAGVGQSASPTSTIVGSAAATACGVELEAMLRVTTANSAASTIRRTIGNVIRSETTRARRAQADPWVFASAANAAARTTIEPTIQSQVAQARVVTR